MSDPSRSTPLVPPIFTSAVYTLPDLDALEAIYAGTAPGFIYARDGHPNGTELAQRLNPRESASWGIVTGSGMGATSAAVLALTSVGDRIVMSDRLYGRTTRLLGHELPRYGVRVATFDANDPENLRAILQQEPARMVYVETIANPLVQVADLPTLAEIAHESGSRLVVDNTFATPVLCRPLELGADLVVESLTKLIGGHSDVTLGYLGGTDPSLAPRVGSLVSTWGLAPHPFECWLVQRGMETLDLRVRAACQTAAQLADWLAEQPGIARVVYPGRSDHPDHALAGRMLDGGYGNMLCFELPGGRDAVNRFMRAAPGIPFSPSLGHTSTTCSHPASTSHRHEDPAERARLGITEGLIRLSVGCEPFETARAAIQPGLL